MKPTRPLPSAQFLNDRFAYDPESGIIHWKQRPQSDFKDAHAWKIFLSKLCGKEAGYKNFDEKTGLPKCITVSIKIGGKNCQYRAHRLIFAMQGIPIPDGIQIDHRDLNPFNNRWDNLRLATGAQNAANQKGRPNRKHKLPKGVFPKRKIYRAQIGYNGSKIFLGYHKTPEAANAAYAKKATELYGDFARAN